MVAKFLFAAVGAIVNVGATLAPASANRISEDFVDKRYRIERQFVPPSTANQLLVGLLLNGIPFEGEDSLPIGSLRKVGDAGDVTVPQYQVDEYAAVLQDFIRADHHTQDKDEKHSLVYYLEMLDGLPSFDRTQEIIATVATHAFLDRDHTAHLYLSTPGTAALDNHTDITDIVVMQLDGAKEWFLCTEREQEVGTTDFNSNLDFLFEDSLSSKLNSCSKYTVHEIESLDCERTTLYPGDVLFLPRRVLHSARALEDGYSAHLTFGYLQEEAKTSCSMFDYDPDQRQLNDFCCKADCDAGVCNCSCDIWGFASCDRCCNLGCDGDCWC